MWLKMDQKEGNHMENACLALVGHGNLIYDIKPVCLLSTTFSPIDLNILFMWKGGTRVWRSVFLAYYQTHMRGVDVIDQL